MLVIVGGFAVFVILIFVTRCIIRAVRKAKRDKIEKEAREIAYATTQEDILEQQLLIASRNQERYSKPAEVVKETESQRSSVRSEQSVDSSNPTQRKFVARWSRVIDTIEAPPTLESEG